MAELPKDKTFGEFGLFVQEHGVKAHNMTEKQTANEILRLRQRIAELEKLEIERNQSEKVKRENIQLFETIFDNTHILIAYMDPRFNFIIVNKAYAEADNRDPSFFPGKNHFNLYHNAENEEIFKRVVETGEPYYVYDKPFEYAEHPERGVTYWDWSLIPVKDPRGAVTGLVLTLENVTERKQAEKALRSIEWMLTGKSAAEAGGSMLQPYGDLTVLNTSRLILDSVGGAVLFDIVSDYLDLLGTSAAVYEKNGDYAFGIFSSGWCRFMDWASRQRCGTPDNREALTIGRWLCHESCWTDASHLTIETGEPVDIECRGGIHLYAAPIRAGGKIVGSINFGYGDPPRDMEKLRKLAETYGVNVEELIGRAQAYETRPPFIIELAKKRLHSSAHMIGEIIERKRAEDEVKQMADELSRSNADLQQFAYAASHDLQEPLRGVEGFVKLFARRYKGKLDEKADEFIEYIVEGVKRMQVLIKDLLEYSQVSTKGRKLKPMDSSLAVVQALVNLKTAIEESGAVVTYDTLPIVMADSSQLSRLFQNLIGNSIKFRREEPPEIHISAEQKENEWVFSIKDNSIGIDPKNSERIFAIFQRLHGYEYLGTGIGLALCRKIVERHGGRIWVESELGKGATFYFTIPFME